MLLEELRIIGYQSHVDTSLVFHGKSNVVKGDNASGKSAIRRALLWVLTNKPTGTAFINWGFDDRTPCEVVVKYDGHDVRRRRSRDGKINEYVVDGEVLTAFGVSVPQAVVDIFKLDDTNIELQHSALFMLSESAPDMARRLNKLTNLESIDTAYGSIRRRKLEAGRKLKDFQERHTSLEQDLEKYDFLPHASNVVKELEENLASIESSEHTLQDVNALVSDISEAIVNIQPHVDVDVADVLKVCNALQDAVREFQSVDGLYASIMLLPDRKQAPFLQSTIQVLHADVVDYFDQWQGIKSLIADISRLSITKYPPLHAKDMNVQEIKDITNEYMDVQRMLDDLSKIDVNYKHAVELKKRIKFEYDALMPDVCPLCGNITCGE